MALKALLCSGNDEPPQHQSVLRAIHTLNSPQNYIRLLGGLLPIHTLHWRGAQGLMWGTRGPFLLAAVMVGYGCVGQCWPLEANIRSTYCRNSKNCLRKYFFYSYIYRIHSWHLTWQLNKEDLDLHTFNVADSYAPSFTVFNSIWALVINCVLPSSSSSSSLNALPWLLSKDNLPSSSPSSSLHASPSLLSKDAWILHVTATVGKLGDLWSDGVNLLAAAESVEIYLWGVSKGFQLVQVR